MATRALRRGVRVGRGALFAGLQRRGEHMAPFLRQVVVVEADEEQRAPHVQQRGDGQPDHGLHADGG